MALVFANVVVTTILTGLITFLPMTETNDEAPEGWRNLQDITIFAEQANGMSCSGGGELEVVNGNLPVDGIVTYNASPSLRLNVTTEVSSYWWLCLLTLRSWCPHDVSQYVSKGFLEFNVKGKEGGEQFLIGAKDQVRERKSGEEKEVAKPVTDYCTITTEWQRVEIPLADIMDPSLGIDPSNIMVIVLKNADLNPLTVWLNGIKITSRDKEKSYPAIKVNQIGFLLDGSKYALVSGFEDELQISEDTIYDIRDISNDRSVFEGRLSLVETYDQHDSGEKIFKADFSSLEKAGDYYIAIDSGGIDRSPVFRLGDDVFMPLMVDAARYFYYQRSGIELTKEYCPDYPRKDLTPQDVSAVFDSNENSKRNVTKGWYDAGDLGKYVSSGSTALSDLFWAYEFYPSLFVDNQLDIPESGNGVPDILDEARWEIEWIIKMQDPGSGGFYARVQSDNDSDVTKRIVRDREGNRTNIRPTDDTACAAAVLAHSYLLFLEYDQAFAERCLHLACKAWDYLDRNPHNIKSPNGPYSVDDDRADRLWASASLFRATHEQKYNNYFVDNYREMMSRFENQYGDGSGCSNNWMDAFFCYSKSIHADNDALEWFSSKFKIWLDNKFKRYEESPWDNVVTNGNYYWGINSQILGISQEAIIGSSLLGEHEKPVHDMAMASLNWILGANPMRLSFVSGYGHDDIDVIFSVIYGNDGREGIPKGYLPGGPNRYEGGGLSRFPAKNYLESAGNWTTNEHTVYWNSALVFVAAYACQKNPF